MDEALKRFIDRWLEERGLNPYGDPKDTFYAGGSPLFDERTGKRKDRYQHVLERYPEILDEFRRRRRR